MAVVAAVAVAAVLRGSEATGSPEPAAAGPPVLTITCTADRVLVSTVTATAAADGVHVVVKRAPGSSHTTMGFMNLDRAGALYGLPGTIGEAVSLDGTDRTVVWEMPPGKAELVCAGGGATKTPPLNLTVVDPQGLHRPGDLRTLGCGSVGATSERGQPASGATEEEALATFRAKVAGGASLTYEKVELGYPGSGRRLFTMNGKRGPVVVVTVGHTGTTFTAHAYATCGRAA